MTEKIHRGFVSYLGVLNSSHNAAYLKLIEAAISDQQADLNLSWGYGYDPDEFEDEEEMAEEIAENPWYKRTLFAGGEPAGLMVFFDDQASIDLRGASEEWILLVNRILRDLEDHTAKRFGEDYRMLARLNGSDED